MTTHGNKQEKRSLADWWLLVLGFVLFSALGFWLTPTVLYAEKDQPFQFSHELHMEQVMDGCQSCHYFREDGSFSGIPGLQKCTECHMEEPLGDTPEEKVFAHDYVATGRPVPWKVYSDQPPCEFFSHAAHTENAGLDCAQCHGDHGQSQKLPPYEYNRLTGYSRMIWGKSILGLGGPPDRMKMDDCAKCHRENGVRDACFVCHK
jgi:hypothetical protein